MVDYMDCGPGRLHFMKVPFPMYAPWPYVCHEVEPAGICLGESVEKAGWTGGRLLRTLSEAELDAAIETEFGRRFGVAGLYSPIAWARLYQPFQQQPPPAVQIEQQLQPFLRLLGRSESGLKIISIASLRDSLRVSLRASLGDSLWDSLGASLWDSLRASLGASLQASLVLSTGSRLAGTPKPELDALLDVWRAGACPVGFSGGSLVVLTA